ncbi:MAG: protein translocase subunit SecD [Clostridiales bacterium]|nr:protein translocase subunit SecD [Clostridiales bacterium]
MKKLGAIIVIVVTAFVWVITVVGIGPLGPIQDDIKLGLDISGGVYVVLEADTDATGSELAELMEQTRAIIDNRVNEMGLAEPSITIEGEKYIRIELPGVDDPEEAIQTIGTTARLQFQLADGTVMLEGNDVTGSTVQVDQDNGGYLITLEFTNEGGQKFYEATTRAFNNDVEEPFIEGVFDANQIAIVLDDDILSAPSVTNGPISGGSAVITRGGGFGQDEAIRTSTLIRAGALPVDLHEIESSAVGARLGMNALENSIIAGIIGVLLVFIIMILMFRFMGVGASLALLLYVPIILWILVAGNGVLTLPGIAGLILSIGMAVDANVIIFARIRDEVAEGKTIRVAVGSGFRKAIGTVFDAQITTLIAAFVLYQFGTGPVRGFALMLIIGIGISLVTALVITNIFVRVFAESNFIVKRGLFGVREGTSTGSRLSVFFRFVKNRRIFYLVSVALLVIGIGLGVGRGFNLGIDFTGGTMMQIDFGQAVSTEQVTNVFEEHGITDASVVTVGEYQEGAIIRTTQAMTSPDRDAIMATFTETYDLQDDALQTFEQFGPSVGQMLLNNAIQAVLLSIGLMLIYIVIRFRFKLGLAAIITVFHDIAMLIAMYGIFQFTINNPFIAAVLTVVGYSINGGIVVSDRVRENLAEMRKQTLEGIVDTSINQTLVRNIVSTGTTIAAIIPLIILGGDVVSQFAIPLAIGILLGGLSSLFITTPVFYDLAKATHRYGGKYKGAAKLTDAERAKLGAKIPKGDDGSDSGLHQSGGKKKKKNKSNDERRPNDGAVV